MYKHLYIFAPWEHVMLNIVIVFTTAQVL